MIYYAYLKLPLLILFVIFCSILKTDQSVSRCCGILFFGRFLIFHIPKKPNITDWNHKSDFESKIHSQTVRGTVYNIYRGHNCYCYHH